LKERANQERMNELTNKWNSLLMQIADPIMDIIEPLLNVAGIIMDIARPVFKLVGLLFKLGSPIVFLAKMFSNMETKFGKFGIKVKYLFMPFLAVIDFINIFLENMNRGLDEILYGVNSLDTVISEMISSMTNGFSSILQDIIKPFKLAINWIRGSDLHGNSPSVLGEGILNGISSIGPMLLSALTMPFKTGFDIISKLFSATGLSDGVSIDATAKTSSDSEKNNSQATITDIIATNREISAKLTTLIDLMKSGGIAVNIDGSKASYLLAKAKAERGALGAI
jgi:hypothetical protein